MSAEAYRTEKASKTFWTIERYDPIDLVTQYLGVRGASVVSVGGDLYWTDNWIYALQFRREIDAIGVANTLLGLMDLLPHKSSLGYFRSGDPLPRIREHAVVDGPSPESTS